MANGYQNQPAKKDDRFQKVGNIILNNESFLLVANPESFDSLAAASAVAQLLKSLKKSYTLFAPGQVDTNKFDSLIGLGEFVSDLGFEDNKLVIDLDYPLEKI